MSPPDPPQTRASPRADPEALGQFLRARRERLSHTDAGLLPRTRRRTPGLRREDVAALCAISVTWYTWIEQGRTTNISVQTLDALAHGLKLSTAERAYLFQLAARADPAPPPPSEADDAQLRALIQAIRGPAYVLDPHWEARVWNRAAAELFGDWLGSSGRTRQPPGHPSLLRYVFLHPQAPVFILDWEERARQLVAQYRADTPGWREDPRHAALVNELTAASPVFASAWRSQAVLSRDGGSRSFLHPLRGRCHYQQHVLRLAQQSALRLTVLTPM